MKKLSMKEKIFMLKWLLKNTPKKLIDVHTPKTPIQDNIAFCWYPVYDSGRTLYERRYIENVRGKTCSYCGTSLNGKNTHIRVTYSPIKIREEVWCMRCINMDVYDKALTRKVGFDKMSEIKLIKNQIVGLRENIVIIRKTKEEYKERYNDFKYRNSYKKNSDEYKSNCRNFETAIDLQDTRINKVKNEIEELKNEINGILKNNKSARPTYVIDYDEIIPFRREEDFDF